MIKLRDKKKPKIKSTLVSIHYFKNKVISAKIYFYVLL